jgi:hypothetical protein
MEIVYITLAVLVIVLFGSAGVGLKINSGSVALGGLCVTILLIGIFANTIWK